MTEYVVCFHVEEEKEELLKIASEANMGMKCGDFTFIASAYEGGLLVLSFCV